MGMPSPILRLASTLQAEIDLLTKYLAVMDEPAPEDADADPVETRIRGASADRESAKLRDVVQKSQQSPRRGVMSRLGLPRRNRG